VKKDLKDKVNPTRQPTRVKLSTAQLRQLESERRRIVEALHQSETMFRTITEKSIVGVYLIQDEVFRYVNPNMGEIFGYTVQDMVDKRGPKDVVFYEDWPIVQENLRKRIDGELESITYRFRGLKSAGEIIDVEVYGSRTDYQGKPAVIGTLLDITRKMEVERDLQMQLHRFQALYHIAMAMAAEHSLEENLALLVDKCRELLKTDASFIAFSDGSSDGMAVCAQSGLIRNKLKKLPASFLAMNEVASASLRSGEGAETCFRLLQELAKKEFLDEHLLSGIAVPLQARNTAIGVLCVGSHSNKTFSESKKDLLCLMGNIASLEITRKQAEDRLAQSENELRHLSAQLLRAQEDERKRVAHELHDGIGQSISAIKFRVETCVKQIQKNPGLETTRQLQTLLPMVQSTVEEVQRIAVDLRPFIIDDLGVVVTLRWFLRQFQNTYSDIRLEKRISLEEHEIPESLKIVIFRIVQEALNNVSRHSLAKRVQVALRKRKGRIELLIKDNGSGIDGYSAGSPSSHGRGFGLSSMKERTELSGGMFRLDTGPSLGTCIAASWPLKPSTQCR
jgi:PAS domain S-box-containing protein